MENSGLVDAVFLTDQGQVRTNNQDFVGWQEPDGPEAEKRDGWVYILADGAGGMDAGEIASSYATERTLHHYLEAEESAWDRRLLAAMYAANDDLRELSAKRDRNSRMATTMVAAVISDDQAYLANVGDSRAYLWQDGEFRQVTKDQSLVAKLLDEGIITAEEAEHHPRKNVILYSLGSEREPRIDLFTLRLEPGNRLLLCSDGLTRHVKDAEMKAVLEGKDLDEAAHALVDLANERGGEDNISVGLLEFSPPLRESASTVTSVTTRVDIPPVVVPSSTVDNPAGELTTHLWVYTVVLAVIQTILILLVWSMYRL